MSLCWQYVAKILQNHVAMPLNCTGNKTAHKAYLETSVGVVEVVKKCSSNQKHCGGMGCGVVQEGYS